MIVSIKPEQAERVNALVRSACANCQDGCCLLLDDGDSHPCVQLLSVSGIYCNYFYYSFLPTDKTLYRSVIQNINYNSNTKIADILSQYPWLLDELAKISDRFKMAKTPMGKMMLKKATIADMSKRSGVDVSTLIVKLNELIIAHEGK